MRTWEVDLTLAWGRTVEAIKAACAALPDEETEGAMAFYDRRQAILSSWEYGSELRQTIDGALLDWLANHGNELEFGDKLIRGSGKYTDKQIRSNSQILQDVIDARYKPQMLEITGGDETTVDGILELVFKAVDESISANSALKSALPTEDLQRRSFRRDWAEKVDGRAKKKLTIGPRRFMEHRAASSGVEP